MRLRREHINEMRCFIAPMSSGALVRDSGVSTAGTGTLLLYNTVGIFIPSRVSIVLEAEGEIRARGVGPFPRIPGLNSSRSTTNRVFINVRSTETSRKKRSQHTST